MKRAFLSLLFFFGCSSAHSHVELRARVLPAVSERHVRPEHPLAVGANIPRFGCLGTSAAHDVVVCAVGVSGLGNAASVTLAFAALAPGVEAADSIVLLEDRGDVGNPEQTPLERATRAKVASALSGFVTWEPVATLAPGGSFAVRDAQIEVAQKAAPEVADGAPRFDASLEVRAHGRTELLDEVHAQPLTQYKVRIFEAGDGFVLERVMSTAEEGSYVTFADAWLCRGTSCEHIV